MRGPCEKSGESEEQEKEVAAEAPAAVRSAGVPEAEDSDTDSDSNLETEGASGQSMPGSLTFGASLAGMEGTGWHQVGRAPCPAEQGAQVGRELSLGHHQHSRWRQLPVPSLQCSWGIRRSS